MAVANLHDAVRVLYRVVIRILEVHVEEHVHAGVRHLFAPEELPHRSTRTPERHSLRCDAVVSQHLEDVLLVRLTVHQYLHAVLHHAHRSQAYVLAHGLPVALVEALCQMNLPNHCRQHVAVL